MSATPPFERTESAAPPPPDKDLDVAIVGAGVSGLYTAWRLISHDPALRVAIFEVSPRVGGRVLTVEMPALQFNADIGAMRYRRSQLLVSALVKRFKLAEYQYSFPLSLSYLRGRYLLPKVAGADPEVPIKEYDPKASPDASVKDQTAYLVREDERGLDSDGLLALALRRAMAKVTLNISAWHDRACSKPWMRPENVQTKQAKLCADPAFELSYETFTPIEWHLIRAHGSYNNKYLYDLGLWDVIQNELSPEGFALARDGLGYQSIIGNWNAAEFIPWFLADFSTPEFYSVVKGMSRIPLSIRDAFLNDAGASRETSLLAGRVHHGFRLDALGKCIGGGYDLVFGTSSDGGVTFKNSRTISAKKVVLALPKAALASLRLSGGLMASSTTQDADTTLFHESLDCVNGNTLLKAFVFYDKNWWWDQLAGTSRERLHTQGRVSVDPSGRVAGGRVLTDLPIRQIFFHGPASNCWRHAGGNTALMMYCDSREAEYWSCLAATHGRMKWASTDDLGRKIFEDGEHAYLRNHGVDARFEVAIRRYLEFVLAPVAKEVPVASTIIFENWGRPPYGGGWHAWQVGYKPWELRLRLMRPFLGNDVYVVGETFSMDQGWIEGALRSAECVLNKWFRIEAPSWLDPFSIDQLKTEESFRLYIGALEADWAEEQELLKLTGGASR